MNIPLQRLHNQYLTRARRGSAADLVGVFGAVQAQEYAWAKWALALRLAGVPADAGIEAAIERGEILRTHVLRPTWHFVAARDLVWILKLTAPRVHARLTSYMPRMGLDKRTVTKTVAIIERVTGDETCVTRSELQARLARAGIALKGTPLALAVMSAELDGIICSGPRRGKQFTYALISERAPNARALDRDAALAELTRRYFTSHGPATVRDFVWWSSLTTSDAKRGLEMSKARSIEADGVTYWTLGPRKAATPRGTLVRLLPIYDEFLVAYRDRIAVPHDSYALGAMRNALMIDGQVAGTWTADRSGKVKVRAARRLSAVERAGVEAEVERFAQFVF